ncbi:L-threonine ammonia-lyase-like isoform X2 [Anticarsia gemmatalis]|uniref:L-threonine ammonia-lyase-like isoform X2 n=1 Tax=Anticarsia gemmatalis TaxID=129554 RepID=UPI003F768B80
MSRRYDDAFDEFCDPDNPRLIKYDDVVEAAQRIKPLIPTTPCLPSHSQRDFGIYIYFKLETAHSSGSFKERGALNALLLLPPDKKKLGVVIASVGNEALGFSYHAAKLGIPIFVVYPILVPISKLQRCHAMGGKVILQGNTLAEAQKYARTLAKEKGLTYINGRDHPHILNGYGTLGLELMEQLPIADAIIVPLGTGSLAGSVATVVKKIKPSCLIYGVESESMPVVFKSLENGEPVTNMPVQGNFMGHALPVTSVSVNGYANAKALLDKVLLVKDDWVARAMLHLVEREKFIVEGMGASTMAAIIGNLVPELKTKTVVCILSGGNVDGLMLNRCFERGLAAEGRLIKFKVGVLNQPGAKTALMRTISNAGYNVITHFVDNFWTEKDYRCEVRSCLLRF